MLACLAHLFVGVKETYAIAPEKIANRDTTKDFSIIERNWVQALCAFQLVTIDLIVLPILLFVLAFTELIIPKQTVALCLAAFYALWGIAWLVQLIVLKRTPKDFLMLGQWMLWFICAGLIYWGAQGFDG